MRPPKSPIMLTTSQGGFGCGFCKEPLWKLGPKLRRKAPRLVDCPKCRGPYMDMFTCKECKTINRIYLVVDRLVESRCSDCAFSNEVENKL